MRYVRLRIRRPSKPTIFALLMLASVVMVLLPPGVLAPARNVMQLLAPLQIATLEATRGVAAPIRELAAEPPDPGEQVALRQANQALLNENATLREQVTQLQAAIDDLSGIRRQGFPPGAVLIPARVVSLDPSPGRDSMLVSKGHVQDVRPGDWVTTRLELDAGTAHGVHEAAAVLARQCLIGWVQHATPFTSRVVLLSDRLARNPMRVHIAPRLAGNSEHRVLTARGKPLVFVLEGTGQGGMRVRDVPAAFVDAGHVRIGDLVTCDPNNAGLPLPLVVGEIRRLDINRDNPVHYDAEVRSLHDARALTRVFIAGLGRGAESPAPQAH